MQTQNRLKIALQKKGRLSQDCAALLKQCGVKINWNEQRLVAYSENMPIEILIHYKTSNKPAEQDWKTNE